MGLPNWYIYRRYVSRLRRKWMRRAYWLPDLLLLVGMAVIFSAFEPKPHAMSRMSVFLVIFLCVYVPKAIFTIFDPLFRLVARKCYASAAAAFVAVFTLGYLIFGATEGKQHFQVKEVEIRSKDIPEGFDGYRIVQLSDIHAGSWAGNPEALQKAVSLVNAQQPDLILFTGDLVNNLATEVDEFIPIFSQLRAKDGVYSVLGNHDYSLYIRWENEDGQRANLDSLKAKEARMGWRMLHNENTIIRHGGDSIALIGVENAGHAPFPDFSDLKRATEGTDGMFRILMSHDPSHWRREVLPDSDIQLTLSGHTHNMQLSFFGFSPSAFVYPEHSGLYREGDQMLYVNVGLGHLMFPMRLGAWPEITLFTLSSK